MRICLSGKRTRASQMIQLNWAIQQKNEEEWARIRVWWWEDVWKLT